VSAALRGIPAAHRFLTDRAVAGYADVLGPANVKAELDALLAETRAVASADGVPAFGTLLGELLDRLARAASAELFPVINATGILLHTNLGRAPLAADACDAMCAIGAGYSNLEYDVAGGRRGSRYERVTGLLCAASGAEDALVVNNCAAAVLLIVDTFAKGREVVVARNQLIEIGGGFRLPEVLAASGARLREVGTTNRVYLADFERALSPETALLLRSHPSNYRIEGFTADVAPRDLVGLGRRTGLVVAEDLGSGALVDLARYGLPHERTVGEAVADGLDLVAWSGDKLFGGPQAGVIVGRRAAISRLRANPLLRALRVDKTTLAALAATARLHLEPGGVARIPFYAMLAATAAQLEARAVALCAVLAPLSARAAPVATTAYAGGGALPLSAIPSYGIALTPERGDPNALAQALRGGTPPLIARTEGDAVRIDLRTIPPERDADVVAAVERACAA
jgi:L-seryl-tRNA(Ser) seleniumtransferase